MSKFLVGPVILCECTSVGEGRARLADIVSIVDGVASVDGKRFDLDTREPWDIPANRSTPTRYILKPDTQDNRQFYGIPTA